MEEGCYGVGVAQLGECWYERGSPLEVLQSPVSDQFTFRNYILYNFSQTMQSSDKEGRKGREEREGGREEREGGRKGKGGKGGKGGREEREGGKEEEGKRRRRGRGDIRAYFLERAEGS